VKSLAGILVRQRGELAAGRVQQEAEILGHPAQPWVGGPAHEDRLDGLVGVLELEGRRLAEQLIDLLVDRVEHLPAVAVRPRLAVRDPVSSGRSASMVQTSRRVRPALLRYWVRPVDAAQRAGAERWVHRATLPPHDASDD